MQLIATLACLSSIGGSEIVGGVVAGLIASAIAWVVLRGLRWKRDRDDFGVLSGDYRVIEKPPWEQAQGTVTITVNGSILAFEWTWLDGSEARGTIAMDERSRVTGLGSYEHTRHGSTGWGYLSIRIASREPNAARILVDGWYTDKEQYQRVATAWFWDMTSTGK